MNRCLCENQLGVLCTDEKESGSGERKESLRFCSALSIMRINFLDLKCDMGVFEITLRSAIDM
jgi:hypothetical protein